MERLHLTVMMTRNEPAWRSWKRLSKFSNSNFLLAVWSKLSIHFTSKILRELGNKKILFYKLSCWYLVVKPACVNAASEPDIIIIYVIHTASYSIKTSVLSAFDERPGLTVYTVFLR